MLKSNPTLPEGLAGNAWEPSKRNLLFLTLQHLGSASHSLPLKILNSLTSLTVNSDTHKDQYGSQPYSLSSAYQIPSVIVVFVVPVCKSWESRCR
jgi:hypothetical protein